VDRTLVDGDQMVAVQIQFAAVSTTTLKEVGFNFQSLGHGLQIATQAPSTVSSTAGSSFYGMPGSTGLSLTNSLPLKSAFNLLIGSPQNNILTALSALNSRGANAAAGRADVAGSLGQHGKLSGRWRDPDPGAAGRQSGRNRYDSAP
jgi:pilus assembly protein CpaC